MKSLLVILIVLCGIGASAEDQKYPLTAQGTWPLTIQEACRVATNSKYKDYKDSYGYCVDTATKNEQVTIKKIINCGDAGRQYSEYHPFRQCLESAKYKNVDEQKIDMCNRHTMTESSYSCCLDRSKSDHLWYMSIQLCDRTNWGSSGFCACLDSEIRESYAEEARHELEYRAHMEYLKQFDPPTVTQIK